MNQTSSLTNSDITHLYQILEEANKNYIRESRAKEKPAFNILRLLSAMRLLFPQSPTTLYNAIIFITKNYDPQTHYQWKKAIEDLDAGRGLFRSKSNYCRPQLGMHTRTYQNSFNRSRINDSHEHFQSKSYAQINIPQETSHHQSFFNEDQKEQSQTNAETGKRMFYTKADSMSHISKNHYISFEPYRNQQSFHEDKENINSTNVQESRKKSSYQYIQAIQRDLIRTAKQSQNKTPIDQSFIKKINSYESPYLCSRQEQEHDPIEEQMNKRAQTFYRFNLQLKVISSLQANSYVFQKAKENEKKAKSKHRFHLFAKTFKSLLQNIHIQRHNRANVEKADTLLKEKTYSKIFNIMKLMYDLNKQKVHSFDTAKMKKANYEFILSLLLAFHSQKEEELGAGFNDKIMELIHSDQSNKLYLIVKYFGKHTWITQKNIQELVNQYKISICKRVFSTLLKEKEGNAKFGMVRQTNLKKQSFLALKLRWNLFSCYKQKIKTAQSKRNKRVLHKVMKCFLQMVFSTKLYSKRCEYIERKHLLHLKTETFSSWIEQARQHMRNRQIASNNCSRLSQILQKLIKRIFFNNIKTEIRELDSKIRTTINHNNAFRKSTFFSNLKGFIQKNHSIARNISQVRQVISKAAIQRWKMGCKRGKAIEKIVECIKLNYFRQLVLPQFQYAITMVREMRSDQQATLRQTFLALKRIILQESSRKQALEQRLKKRLLEMTKVTTLRAIESFNLMEREAKEKQQLNNKVQRLQNCKQNLVRLQFISELAKQSQYRLQSKQTKHKLLCRIHQMRKRHCLAQLQQYRIMHINTRKVEQMVYELRKTQLFCNVLNVVECSRIQKVRQLRKKNSSLELSKIISSIYKQQVSKKIKAKALYQHNLQSKTIQGFTIIRRQSNQVCLIAKQAKLRNILTQIKDSLMEFRRQNKLLKLHQKYGKKALFDSLIMRKHNANKQNVLSMFSIRNIRERLIKGLRKNKNYTKEQQQLDLKAVECLKMRVMKRMQLFYIHSLVSKKHIYMALKFRALKLCLNAFSAFLSKKEPKRSGFACHKLLAERLSTDLV